MPDIRTPERTSIVDKVRELGPKFAERAVEVDRDATFPHANWADLRDAGLLGIAIPKTAGGLGADYVGYALASEEIGRYCGSTGLTFNMHVATTLLVGEFADIVGVSGRDKEFLDARRERLWSGVINDHHIHSQPFSEGVQASATAGYATRAEPVDGGYLVSGRKIFASLAGACTYHNVLCLVEGEPVDQLRLLGVPHVGEGVTIEGEWDSLGMRGTDSRNLVMDKVFVPAENEWLPPGLFTQIAARYPFFFLSLSFTYLGMMRGIVDFTENYLKSSGRRDYVIKQQGWAELNIKYEQAQALLYRVLADADRPDPSDEIITRAWASLVTTMEGCPEMASTAIRVCGGRSMLRPSYIERVFRDARAGATMLPWSAEVCLSRLGQARLYDDLASDA